MNAIVDQLRFFRALIARPKNIGAVAPSGPQLARALAAQIVPGGPLLELGPGTGCVTAEIIRRVDPATVTAIEYDGDFAQALKARFPAISVIQGDAFELDKTLGPDRAPFATIISGLPLLNFPMQARHRLIAGALARLTPNGVLLQFSYGMHAPVVPPDGYIVTQAAFCWANFPPARVWAYRRV